MRIYLPEKVAERLRWISLNYFSKVDQSLCLPKLKSISVLLYDFSTAFFCNYSCIVEVTFNLRTF